MQRPIGVIDSGVGGLTVLNELVKKLPYEKFIYFGDTQRSPYGSKTKKEVQKYVYEVVEFLKTKNIKVLVIACNTATAFAYESLTKSLSIPVIGVIEPGARAAIKVTKNNIIGIIGTVGTIKSKAYTKALTDIHPSVSVYSLACPKFVPMIENGIITGEQVLNTVSDTLYPYESINIDTLILGCTHYPIIQDSIQKTLGENVEIVSSATETATETKRILNCKGIFEESNNYIISHELYTSGQLEKFMHLTNLIFRDDTNKDKEYICKTEKFL